MTSSSTRPEGACQICTALRDFQSGYLRTLNARTVQVLCNIHTWMVANAGDAGVVAEVFLRMLDSPLEADLDDAQCDLCRRTSEEENARIERFAQQLSEASHPLALINLWQLCLPHGRKLLGRVPQPLRPSTLLAIGRHTAELRQKLTTLARDAKARIPVRPGLLGRAAEYLVAKRGLGVRKLT